MYVVVNKDHQPHISVAEEEKDWLDIDTTDSESNKKNNNTEIYSQPQRNPFRPTPILSCCSFNFPPDDPEDQDDIEKIKKIVYRKIKKVRESFKRRVDM